MNELGQMLREARETRQISLAEAEAQTRIRQKFMAALEAEEWDLLPNDVATRGFLRKYAEYLGLNPEQVLQRFHNRTKTQPLLPEGAAVSDREVDYRPLQMDLSTPPRRDIPWKGISALLLVAVLAGLGLYLYFYQPDLVSRLINLPRQLPGAADVIALEPTASPTATMQINRVTATHTATSAATATPTPLRATPTVIPAQAITATAAITTTATTITQPFRPANQIELAVNITSRSWIRVITDDRLASEAILEAGTTQSWQAQQTIIVRTGNAAGVQITINGQTLPPLGGVGEVVERQWQLVDGQIVLLTPENAVPVPSATAAP
ncbi:MAG: helix-turn-helix domain-containing protein [Caldilineales bacterium]